MESTKITNVVKRSASLKLLRDIATRHASAHSKKYNSTQHVQINTPTGLSNSGFWNQQQVDFSLCKLKSCEGELSDELLECPWLKTSQSTSEHKLQKWNESLIACKKFKSGRSSNVTHCTDQEEWLTNDSEMSVDSDDFDTCTPRITPYSLTKKAMYAMITPERRNLRSCIKSPQKTRNDKSVTFCQSVIEETANVEEERRWTEMDSESGDDLALYAI